MQHCVVLHLVEIHNVQCYFVRAIGSVQCLIGSVQSAKCSGQMKCALLFSVFNDIVL